MSNPNEYGVVTAPGEVRMERVLPGSAERVWQYLTDSELRGKWLARGELQPVLGGSVNLQFHHVELSGEAAPEGYEGGCDGGAINGRVTQYAPYHTLSYTWDGEDGEYSEVTFEVAPQADGRTVLLTLTHRRLPNREEMVCVASGWHAHLGILEDVLHERQPRPFWTTHMAVERVYCEQLAAEPAHA